MSNVKWTALVLTVILLFTPFLGNKAKETALEKKAAVTTAKTEKVAEKSEKIRVKITETNEIKNLSLEEYLIGCIGGEMPVSYETEALKAQAVAALTFAVRKGKTNSGNDYDITDNYKIDQCCLTEELLKEKWGEKYEENLKKIKSVISETENQILTFKNEPALTVYHAVSCGHTYSCKEVWGEDLSYLSSVDSSFDKLSPNYKSETKISKSDFSDFLTKQKIKADSFDFEVKKNNDRVEYVVINKEKLDGNLFTEFFGLKSRNFDIKYENDEVIFTCFGYGHGVGMSQYGANEMAKNGSSYKEILSHYYKGCKLTKL